MSFCNQNSDINTKICEQIEYYFGDLNLTLDKFLQNEINKDDGWVPFDILLKFPRLQQLTTAKPTIASALKDSKLVVVSEDGEKVRRNPAVPIPDKKQFWQELKTRTVYIKNFPLETTLNEIKEYLKPYGAGDYFNMQKDKESVFKGSVYVSFKDKELAVSFVKSTQKYKDIELIKMMHEDVTREVEEENERKAAEIAFNREKKQLAIKHNIMERDAALISKGELMHIYGLPAGNGDASLLEEFFNKYDAPVDFLIYKKGSSKAKIRFRVSNENIAVGVLDKMKKAAKEESDGKIMFLGQEIQCKLLDGAAEEKYWADFARQRAETFKPKVNDCGINFTKGHVLHLSGLPSKIPAETFEKFFSKYASIARTVYETGSSEAMFLFNRQHQRAAVKALEKINEAAKKTDGKIFFQGHEIQCKVYESLEEVEIYENLHGHNSPENTQLSEDEDDTFSVISYRKDVEASENGENDQNNNPDIAVGAQEEKKCCII